MSKLMGYKVVGYDPETQEGFSLTNPDVIYDVVPGSVWKKSNGFNLETSKVGALNAIRYHKFWKTYLFALLEFDLQAEFFLFDSHLQERTICASKAKLEKVTIHNNLESIEKSIMDSTETV